MTRAPATGPLARRTARQSPSALRAMLRSTAADSRVHQEGAGRSRTGNHRPEGPVLQTGLQDQSQSRLQLQCGLLQVVVQGPAQLPRVPRTQRVHQVGRDLRRSGAGVQLVEAPVDRRGGQPVVGEAEHPVVRAAGQGRHDLLPSPTAHSRPAQQSERHVTAQLGGQRPQVLRGDVEIPQQRAGQQRRGRVGRPAGQPARNGDRLLDLQKHPEGVVRAVGLGQQPGRPDSEVRVVQRHQVGTLPA